MSGYDEAVAWFRADPERVRDLDDVDNRSAAIAIVNAVLADDALVADPSPRSWSLPAPPPDDVTVVHVDGLRCEYDDGLWWCAEERKHYEWHELLAVGTVVEGEPPAPEPEYAVSNWVRVPTTDGDTVTVGAPALDRRPHPESRWDTRTETWEPAPEPPRFERGFYRLARDLSVKFTGSYRGVRLVAVSDSEGDVVTVWTPGHGEAEISSVALAAAGAVRVEGQA